MRPARYFLLFSCQTPVLVHTKDILYIERNGRYSFITLIDGACLRTMKKMDEILKETDDPGMIRCHTSYIPVFDS